MSQRSLSSSRWWRPEPGAPVHPSQRFTPAFSAAAARQDEARFEALPDQVPPQNLEAERSGWAHPAHPPMPPGACADVLRPEAFYLNGHREIYRTALMLHARASPPDLTAMRLGWRTPPAREGGGTTGWWSWWSARLSTAPTIDQVARPVMDKYLRRQLIRSGK